MKKILCSLTLIVAILAHSQTKRILVYHETNQFRHGSIDAGIAMFEDLGDENNDWITDNSQTSDVFNNSNLAQYDAVVFLNTSGSDENGSDGDLLTASEKLALEDFIASGKGFIGVHAATDTYRDQVWPFYNELVGAIVQTSPNHTTNNFNADMEVITNDPITDFLGPTGSIWNKNEEYYYWEQNGGQLSNDNTILLEVEETVGPNGMVNSYDAARPITWFKESITYDDDNNAGTADVNLTGIRSFYTALGHNSSDYNGNTNFRTMLKNATLWAIGNTLSIGETPKPKAFKVTPNPVVDAAQIHFNNQAKTIVIEVYNILGKQVISKEVNPATLVSNSYQIDMSAYKSGVYVFRIESEDARQSFKVIKL